MDKLENIVVNTFNGEKIPIVDFDEGKFWYEILGYIENPDAKLQKEDRIIKLSNYFDSEIDEADLKDLFFDSPINKVLAKMYFYGIEAERLSSKERVGNEICRYCGANAQAITVQTRSADEASSVKVSCLDSACGRVYKIG